MPRLNDGGPREHLKLYHFLFLSYSPQLAAEILLKHNLELNHKSDKLFMDGVYKLVRDMLDYVPKLTKDQFFHPSFAMQKCQMATDLVKLVQAKCKTYQTTATVSSTSIAANTIMPLRQMSISAGTSGTSQAWVIIFSKPIIIIGLL